MSSTTSTPAKRARTDSLVKATEQSPATPSSAARGQHRSLAIEDGHDANRAISTSKVLGRDLSNCKKALEAKDKIIEEKDAEIEALKTERIIQNEVIDALGGNEMLTEALSAVQSKNNSQESGMSDRSQEAKKTTEKTTEKKEDETDRDDQGDADTTAEPQNGK